MATLLLHCHLILLKNWNTSRIYLSPLRSGDANLFCKVPIWTSMGKTLSVPRQLLVVAALNFWRFAPYLSLSLSLSLSTQRHLMPAAVFDPTKLRPAESRCNCSPTHFQHGKAAASLALDIGNNLERLTNLRAFLAQRPC